MKINDNIPALQAYTSLLRVNKNIDKSMRRLASGIRINSVADDAAGMAISNKLKTQISGLEMASRNTMDGISLVQVAEGALQEVHNMLHRMSELAIQSSNASNLAEDRKKINDEIEQLINEINDTAYKTEFNNIKVLNGDAARLAKVPVGDRIYTNVTYVSDNVMSGELQYTVDTLGLPASFATAGNSNFPAVSTLVGQSFTINGDSFTVTGDDTVKTLIAKFQELCDTNNLDVMILGGASWDNYETTGAQAMIYSKAAGSDEKITISGDASLLAAFGFAAGTETGRDAVMTATTHNGEQFSWTSKGNNVEMIGANSKQINLEFKIGGPDSNGNFYTPDGVIISSTGVNTSMSGVNKKADVLDFGMLKLQIGPNKNMELSIQIPDLSAKGLGIEFLNVKSFDAAQRAINQANDAITKVSAVRSKLGAYQNRMEHTYANLNSISENTSGALSRIYDTDMAWEMTQLTQNNVIGQAGMAIMAQANQRPQQILQLLN